MGVSGLLNLLKSIQAPTHLRNFSGQTIGVDAYGWLHRGAVPCAVDLVQGKPTTKYVDFAMHRVRMLVHFGVIPYIVFDGDRLPSKAATEHERAERRRESRSTGLELLRLGKTAQAHQELQKSVDITPEMAGQLIEELRRNNIQYVVAPYEADSQLAYLEHKGIIDAIISEDSDLLVFGAKTLLTKLDQFGQCIMIRQADYTACSEVNLTGWTCADLRCMAILNGCDYLEGIHKMGLKTAYRLVRKCKTIQRVVQCAQLEGKFRIPAGYLESFAQAEMTFLYQWVYCPLAKALVNLTPPESEAQLAGVTYIGQYVEPEIARRVATGQLNPITKLPIVVEWPSNYKRPPLIPKRMGKENALQSEKKIDSFFTSTPNRVPLAELDPNSFAPSQSQQQLLDQNSARSWTPVSVNSRPASAQPLQPLRPTLDGNQQARNIMTAPHSHKRQRLCAEGDNSSADTLFNAHEERSRFFSGKTPQPVLGGVGKTSGKRSKKADINIWSDDSIDDAMASLPNFESQDVLLEKPTTRKQGRSFTIFKDEQLPARRANSNEKDIPQEHLARDKRAGEGGEEQESPFTAGLTAQTEAFRERYAMKTPPNSTTTVAKRGSVCTNAARKEQHLPVEPMTPPPSRLAKSNSSQSPPLETVATIEETPLRKENIDAHSLSTDARPTARAVITATSRLLGDSVTPLPRAVRPKGSEDLLIVPDSDAETGSSAEASPQHGTPTWSDDGRSLQQLHGEDSSPHRPAPRLDLQKFAFGAASGPAV